MHWNTWATTTRRSGELEHINYMFEFTLDYGAYREFKRHRIQTSSDQRPGMEAGFSIPPLVREAGKRAGEFLDGSVEGGERRTGNMDADGDSPTWPPTC